MSVRFALYVMQGISRDGRVQRALDRCCGWCCERATRLARHPWCQRFHRATTNCRWIPIWYGAEACVTAAVMSILMVVLPQEPETLPFTMGFVVLAQCLSYWRLPFVAAPFLDFLRLQFLSTTRRRARRGVPTRGNVALLLCYAVLFWLPGATCHSCRLPTFEAATFVFLTSTVALTLVLGGIQSLALEIAAWAGPAPERAALDPVLAAPAPPPEPPRLVRRSFVLGGSAPQPEDDDLSSPDAPLDASHARGGNTEPSDDDVSSPDAPRRASPRGELSTSAPRLGDVLPPDPPPEALSMPDVASPDPPALHVSAPAPRADAQKSDADARGGSEPLSEAACIVCLVDFALGDRLSELVCGHVFHSECIRPWLAEHALCPLRCRPPL